MQFTFESQQEDAGVRHPAQVRVPFLNSQVGLGDVVARATEALGIPQCGGCKKRQEYLNQHVVLSPYRG